MRKSVSPTCHKQHLMDKWETWVVNIRFKFNNQWSKYTPKVYGFNWLQIIPPRQLFNYLHCFLFLSETDNKFQSPNLEAKLEHRHISQTVNSLTSNCFKSAPIKICLFNFKSNMWIKKYHLNTFFHMNTENEQWLKEGTIWTRLNFNFESILVLLVYRKRYHLICSLVQHSFLSRLSKILYVVKIYSFTLNNNSLYFLIYINIMFHVPNMT